MQNPIFTVFKHQLHSRDHADGNPELISSLPEKIPVYGGDDRIPALTNKVKHNDSFRVNHDLTFFLFIHLCFKSFMIFFYLFFYLFIYLKKLKLGTNLHIKCLFTPCHTTGHICYFITNVNDATTTPAVFTGDTLFLAGCGRFFEGNAEQMHNNFINILAKLPTETVANFLFKLQTQFIY
jgi:hydroxyacylglutathione hydrolase